MYPIMFHGQRIDEATLLVLIENMDENELKRSLDFSSFSKADSFNAYERGEDENGFSGSVFSFIIDELSDASIIRLITLHSQFLNALEDFNPVIAYFIKFHTDYDIESIPMFWTIRGIEFIFEHYHLSPQIRKAIVSSINRDFSQEEKKELFLTYAKKHIFGLEDYVSLFVPHMHISDLDKAIIKEIIKEGPYTCETVIEIFRHAPDHVIESFLRTSLRQQWNRHNYLGLTLRDAENLSTFIKRMKIVAGPLDEGYPKQKHIAIIDYENSDFVYRIRNIPTE